MTDRLESFYENELAYIRRLGSEFAKKRPKIAARLLMKESTGVSADPHVERLIESFAFLTARIRLKLDDEFPELTEALLGILYPHYLAPFPSCGIAQFEVDPERAKLPNGYTVPSRSRLFTHEVNGVPCRFRTAYPVTLWPLELRGARYQTPPFGTDVSRLSAAGASKALIRLQLSAAPGVNCAELQLQQLRFFLNGDDQNVFRLYESLFLRATQVVFRSTSGKTPPVVLPPDVIRPVGFGRDEGLIDYPLRSFLGYRLLTEYFSFPTKFMFFDLLHCDRLRPFLQDDAAEVLIFLDRAYPNLDAQVGAETFQLGCTPIVNLFQQEADPIRLTHTRTEYQILPDVREHWAMEVHSIDGVHSTDAETLESREYEPIYASRHPIDDRSQVYWTSTRRPSQRPNDRGTEVYLSLVDLDFNPTLPAAEVLSVRATCSNRDLPRELRNTGGEDWGFQLEGQAPIRRIRPVIQPTAPRRLSQDEQRWRLISHLSLNHLSITDEVDGADVLHEILKLYEFPVGEGEDAHGDAASLAQRQIHGILSVTSRRKVARIQHDGVQGFCRGIEVTVTFNEEEYAGSGVYLFAAVLERFFALYASLNSATSLVAKSNLRDGFYKQWPFRAGERPLL